MGAGRRKHRFRMDADYRSRAVDETADRATLEGERPVNQPMNVALVDLGPLPIPPVTLLRFRGVVATRTAFVFLTASHGGAYTNPSESQSGQRTRVARASRNQPRPRSPGSLATRARPRYWTPVLDE